MLKNISKFVDHCGRYGTPAMLKYAKNRLIFHWHRDIAKKQYWEKDIHNYRMKLDLYDLGISRALMFFGSREEDHKYVLEQVLKPGMTVLDLGANIGYYALMECKLVGPKGFVYAIEPHPTNFAMLKENIKLNKMENRVEMHQMGGSDKTSVECLYGSNKSNLHTFCLGEGGSEGLNMIEVSTMTVPDFCKGKKKIDLIRMDIEGFEVEVFRGMLDALDDSEFNPSILFETHKPKYKDPEHSMRDVLTKMFEKGYYPKIIISDELPRAKFKENGYTPAHTIPTDGLTRGFYYDMPEDDAIRFICDIGSVRGVLLVRR